MADTIFERKCTGPCGRLLALSEFYLQTGAPDGYRSQCKDCMRNAERLRNERLSATREEPVFKTCKGPCGRYLPAAEFYVQLNSKDGRDSRCKDCRQQQQRENRRTFFADVAEKTCVVCGEIQPIANFDLSALNEDGHAGKCKTCRKAYGAQWHAANREVNNQISRDYNKAHPGRSTEQGRKWRAENPENNRELRQKWARNNPEKLNKKAKRRNAERRIEALTMMGPFCECCNESDLRFLTFDHRFGDGADHRRAIGGSQKACSVTLIRWIQANPAEAKVMLRVLCWSCNAASWRNGNTCPHQEEFNIVAMATEQQSLKLAA